MTTHDLIRIAAFTAALTFLPSCSGDCDDDDTGSATDDDVACDDDTGDDDTGDDDTGDDDTGDDDTTPGDDDTGDDDTAADEPPPYFLEVAPDPTVGTTEAFWIAKYEMKLVGHDDGDVEYDEAGVAESRPSGIPWQWMNQEQARAECEDLGEGFALPTNAEWMTVARSIEANARNWSDAQVHPSGASDAQLNMGHTCRRGALGSQCRMDQFPYSGEGLPASIDDGEGLYGYVHGDYEAEPPSLDDNGWSVYRRTFHLADDQVIWDFAGNVWEWVDWYVPLAADRANYGEVTDDFLEVNLCLATAAMPDESFKSLNTEMTGLINAHGLGRYHPTAVDDDAGAAMRGGNFMHGTCNNGIYALGMGYPPDSDHIICRVGFRCVWHPPAE
jgi:hypothetical protein